MSKILPPKNVDSIIIDGSQVVEANTPAFSSVKSDLGAVGKFNYSHGVVCFVAEDRIKDCLPRTYLAANNPNNIDALIKAGFQRDANLSVHYSQGQRTTYSSINSFIAKITADSIMQGIKNGIMSPIKHISDEYFSENAAFA